MTLHFRLTVATCLLAVASAQYEKYHYTEQQAGPAPTKTYQAGPAPIKTFQADPYYKASTPMPLIVSHKQALSHDGSFNFAFAADNGLQQGETIAPDGTRTGAYSYVDPQGKKITVKYTAGKEGFRILQGDHVPRAPQVGAQTQPQQKYAEPHANLYTSVAQPQRYFRNFHGDDEDDGQYRESYERPQEYRQSTAAPPQQYVPHIPYKEHAIRNTNQNALREEPDYNDEPGKAHSFGNGYSFEFSG